MFQQTPLKQVLFKRTLSSLMLGVLSMAAILYGGFALPTQKAYAVSSSTVNFQARLEGPTGNIAADGFYNVEFKLYSASTGGTALWTEDYYDANGVTAGQDNRIKVINGYVSVALGSQTAFPSTINWDQNLWITMNVGGTTQTATPTYDGEMNPRLALGAVPYAFKAGQLATSNSAGTLSSTLSILQPTVGSQVFQIADQAAAGTYNVCIQGAANAAGGCAASTGGAGYIQNQSASAQTSSNFWISGTGQAATLQATSLLAPSLDTAAFTGTLTLAGSNATTINIANNAVAHTLAIATGAAAQTVTIGSTNTTSTTTIQSGTGGINLNGNLVSVGTALFKNNANSTTAFQIQNAAGTTNLLRADTTNNILAVAGTFYNYGASLNVVTALGNFPTGGSMGNNYDTVDIATYFTINQTTAGQSLTIPGPTNTAAGRVIYISNIGTAAFNLLGSPLNIGVTATLVWNGTAWTYSGADANSILNGTALQTADFNISGTGTTTALQSNSLDRATSGALAIGSNNASQVNIGNPYGTTQVSIQAGTGVSAIRIGTGGIANTITIGNIAGAVAQTINLGTNTTAGSTGTLTLGSTIGASATTIQGGTGNINLNGNLVTSGSTVNTVSALGNFASGGPIGTAAATVDVKTYFTINQTTAGQSLTVPTPTTTSAGRVIYISNIGTQSFNLIGSPLATSATATLVWSGSAWTFSGADANSVLNQTATAQSAGFNVNGNGTVGGQLNVGGDVYTGGINRLTSGGSLQNVAGFNQTSGSFLATTSSTQFLANSFQVVGGDGTPTLTSGQGAAYSNLIVYGSGAESNGYHWLTKGSGTGLTYSVYGTDAQYDQSTTGPNVYDGNRSYAVTTASGTANTGVKYQDFGGATAIATSSTYILSFYAKASGSNFSTLSAGMSYDGTTDTACSLNTTTVTTTGFNRYYCTFTTPGTLSNTNIFMKVTDATSHTFYLDDVQLQPGSALKPYTPNGYLMLQGTVTSPAVFQNSANSTSAFQIQNAAGTSNLFTADTLNGAIAVGGNLVVKSATDGANNFVVRDSGDNTSLSVNNSSNSVGIGRNVSAATDASLYVGDASSRAVIRGNSTGTGNLLELQKYGANVVTVDTTGIATYRNSLDSTSAFRVQNAAGTSLLSADTSNMNLSVSNGTVSVLGLSAPTSVALATTSTTGSLAAGSYYYKLQAFNPSGHTAALAPTPASVTTTGTTSKNTVTWAQVPGATGYYVFRSTDAGATWYRNTLTGGGSLALIDNGTNYGWSGGVYNQSTTPMNANTTSTLNLDTNGNINFGSNASIFNTGNYLVAGNGAAGGVFVAQADTFIVQDTTGYNSNLTISNNGATLFKNRADSTAAFQVQNAAGTSLLSADTSNMNLSVSNGTLSVYGLASPTTVSLATTSTTGTLAAGSYYYKVEAFNTAGHGIATAASPASVTTTGSTSKNTVTWAQVTGATGYYVFRSNDGGNIWYQITISGGGTLTAVDNGSNFTWGGTSYDIYSDGMAINTASTLKLDANGSIKLGTNVSLYNVGISTLLENNAAGGANVIRSDSLYFQDTTGYNNNLMIANTGATTFKNRVNSTSAFQIQNAGGTSLFTADTTNSRVGIGMAPTSIGAALQVGTNGIETSGSLFIYGNNALFKNGSNSANAFQVQNSGGTNLLNVNTTSSIISTSGTMCVNTTSCTKTLGVSGTIGASGAITASTTPDLAETIAAAPDVEAADVVMADPNASERVVKATGAYNTATVGVISDGTSSFMINAYANSASAPLMGKPLVLAGRVPVKVTNENGAIKPGDYLTSSATMPGYAMKATQDGATVGKSLGFFDAASGTVLVFVNLGYYNPASGSALQGSDANFNSLNVAGTATIGRLHVTGAVTVGGSLTVTGVAHLADIEVNGHIITAGSAPTLRALTAAGQGASIAVSGNDTSGTITITTGSPHQAARGGSPEVLAPTAGELAQLTFHKQYGATPRVMLSPADKESAGMQQYSTAAGTTSFTLGITATPGAQQTYSFNYWIVQ